MICSTVRELKLGKTIQGTRADIIKDRNMAKVYMFGVMGLSMMVIGMKIRSRVTVYTNGQTVEYTQANGKKIKCMARDTKFGLMAVLMKDNIKTMSNMDTEYTDGPTDRCIKEDGSRVNNMVQVLILHLLEKCVRVLGIMVKGYPGIVE